MSSAPVQSATPSVYAGGTPYGGTLGSVTVESPTFPLVAVWVDAVDSNTVYAETVPGRLKAKSEIVNGVEQYHQSLAVARFIDHFHLTNAGMPGNSTGNFLYTFLLKGTLKIKADVGASSAVSINAYTITMEDHSGYLEFIQSGSSAILQGPGYVINNIFAESDGSTKVWGTTSAIGGYFTVNVNFRVDFAFTNFPYNQVPSVDDASNLVQFDLSAVSFKNAVSDFSATFEFAEQNPIIPNPLDPTLPASGWDYDSGSGEISLPSPLSVATATGTGDAVFGSGFGVIESLTALEEATIPNIHLIEGEFPHGFFSFDISGLDPGAATDVGITLPALVATTTKWWFYDPVSGWGALPTVAVPGTGFIIITVGDDLAGDSNETDGTVTMVGAPGVVDYVAVFADGFESGGVNAWSGAVPIAPQIFKCRVRQY